VFNEEQPHNGELTLTLDEQSTNLHIITFWLAGQEYGLPITDVAQIVEMVTITKLPGVPPAVQGIINVRGRVVPVIDMRLRFELPFSPYHLHTPIILVEHDEWMLGLVADRVDEVLAVARQEIVDGAEILPDELGQAGERSLDFLLGVGKVGRRMIPIMDLKSILSTAEQRVLKKALRMSEVEE